MTGGQWAAVVLTVSWIGAFCCLLGARRAAAEDHTLPPEVPFAESYMDGLDRLAAAIAAAHRETEPGGPSMDLAECRAIWSDAPSHAEGGPS